MKYAQIRNMDISNGEGVGISLFVQGCPFHCKGCFNPETWNFTDGKDWNIEIENEFVELANKPYIKRISFLGGSPLCDRNICEVFEIIKKIRERYPEKEIWVYTGYIWEAIISGNLSDDYTKTIARKDLLKYIDVLVDGPFVNERKDLTIAFRGSSNQRIIDVKKSLESGEVVLWEEKY